MAPCSVALDGQVMDRRALDPGLNHGDLYPGTGRGLQPHARHQGDRIHPRPQVRDPERVTIGRHDHIAQYRRLWKTDHLIERTMSGASNLQPFLDSPDGDASSRSLTPVDIHPPRPPSADVAAERRQGSTGSHSGALFHSFLSQESEEQKREPGHIGPCISMQSIHTKK
jgi:hypothetical protein